MILNSVFELSMLLDTEHFQNIFTKVYNESGCLRELDDGYLDTSMAEKGISVIYRDSQYKKKIRLLVNASLVVDNATDSDKLLRKLDKHIAEYFNHRYGLDDFILSGVNMIMNIDVGNRANVSAYLKVLRRVGKVKGFSPVRYDCFDEKNSFCLSGNSNGIDFLLYDLEKTVVGQLRSADAGQKKILSASEQTAGILRTEVRLTKPRAIKLYTKEIDAPGQIKDLTENRADVFMDTFTRAIPFGDFRKKDAAMEIIRKEVKDSIMRRKMLRLLALIPEKKSLHLAQKAMDCRDMERVMENFAKINLSPVTLSKRHDIKCLDNLYSYFLDFAK